MAARMPDGLELGSMRQGISALAVHLHKDDRGRRRERELIRIEPHVEIYPNGDVRTDLSREDSGLRVDNFTGKFTSC
ncbi:hypothetical protein NKH99_09320 [Mesorhizobium sp. M0854]|uniref:hypothetical protein n=1 Tax=Mesorhizobium sp. M0854 TaxID=2957013 RepID=UPI00333583DA